MTEIMAGAVGLEPTTLGLEVLFGDVQGFPHTAKSGVFTPHMKSAVSQMDALRWSQIAKFGSALGAHLGNPHWDVALVFPMWALNREGRLSRESFDSCRSHLDVQV
jgi:hypothetical protein